MTLSFLNKKLLNEIFPLSTSRISPDNLGSPSLTLEMLARLLISILIETFLIKVTKAHVLFLDVTFFSFHFFGKTICAN